MGKCYFSFKNKKFDLKTLLLFTFTKSGVFNLTNFFKFFAFSILLTFLPLLPILQIQAILQLLRSTILIKLLNK